MKNRKKTSERGVAVLFSLGILGMMTVLALTFASISMTNQTIAKNATEQSSAKEMARGIVERVQSALSYSGYSPGGIITTPAQLRNFYSKESATSHFDWIWKLGMTGTDIESALYRTDEVCDYSNNAATRPTSDPAILPTWQYVTDSDGKIIGRFAYVVRAADLPVIDLNTAFLKDDGSAATGSYTRLGVSLNELNPDIVYRATLAQLGMGTHIYDDFGTGSSTSPIDNSLAARLRTALPSSGRLGAFADFEKYLPAMSNEAKREISKVIANAYTPRSVKYPEIFLNASGTAVYRFDISQIARDFPSSGTDDQKADYKKALVEKMTGTGTGVNAGTVAAWGSDGNTTKIPWLAEFTDSEGGYDNAQHKAKQIAANIVDFCITSNDDAPTSDVANGSWFTTTPKYIGLKKTPFLYGFGGEAELVVNQTEYTNPPPESTKYYKQTASFKFTPKVGICNFYSCPNTLQIGVSAQFKVTFQISGSGISTENKEITIDYPEEGGGSYETIELNSGSFPTAAGYHYDLDFKSKTANLSEYTAAKSTTITMISLGYKAKVGLKYNGKWVDFSEIRNFKGDGTLKAIGFNALDTGNKQTINTSGSVDFKYPLTFRVSDPRHNLFESQWGGRCHTKNDNAQQWKDLLNASSGTENLYGDCVSRTPVDHDYLSSAAANQQAAYTAVPKNPVNAYVHFPTAGSTITPWEIGQIHRGYAWQTINLRSYKKSDPAKGGTYSQGDANLLDQFRMTSDAFTYGKIPLNEIQDPARYNALIQILRRNALTTSNSTPNNTAGTNAFLKDGDNYKKNLGISDFFDLKSSSPYYFSNRAELSKLLVYSNNYTYSKGLFQTVPSTDAAKEELFAKSVMLFDAEQTFLPRRVYVFGIAQTIKDVGGNGSNITMYKSWNGDGSLTNTSNTSNTGKYTAGYRTGSGLDVTGRPDLSGTINAQLGRYDNGADKILSEQKVFAILEREYTVTPYSSSNRPVWKIVRFEYVQ